MQELKDILIIAYIAIMVIGFLTIGIRALYIDKLHTQIKDVNAFRRDFEAAIKHSQPTWEEMKVIIRANNLSQSKIFNVFQDLMKKILTGEAQDFEPHKELIRSYIHKSNQEEPFEGIPDDIRIHLERLREKIEDHAELLDPLTSQIKDLLSINKRERLQQKYYTTGGFFVGILGLLLAFLYFLCCAGINSTSDYSPGIAC